MAQTADTDERYDYIVIGAGSAGCVLANRLSADPANRVCLLEAGPPDRHPFIHIPAATGAAIGTRSLNWRFMTAPQQHLKGRCLPQPRGHCLGGSSAINGMVYSRGHPLDYDDWAAACNDSGWSYAAVLPYFKRSEDNLDFRDSPWHGTGGPMAVSRIRSPNPLNGVFEQAMAALGYRYNPDLNGPDPEGYGPRQMNIRRGRRVSTATAFLRPARGRSNLVIHTDTLVLRLVIEQGRAVAVEAERDGARLCIGAVREIILCAGALQSPQILMLSGIGDGDQLPGLGIGVVHNLPGVGADLHDHPSAPVMMETRVADSYGLSLRALPRNLLHLFNYLLFRRGALASNLFESAAFLRTRPELDRPDLQFVYQPARKMLSGSPVPIGHGYVLNPVTLYPKSRGRVTLAGPDPHAAPVVDPNLLAEAEDLEPLLAGITIAREVFAQAAYDRYRGVETGPGPDLKTGEQLTEYVRSISYPINHPVGTCRMGADAASVVDPELRVRGIGGLRVADASIFPRIVGGNIAAAVVMVGEKAADLVLGLPAPSPEDHGSRREDGG